MSSRCNECKGYLEDFEKFCTSCGKKVPNVDLSDSCRRCGINRGIERGDKFCHNCGAPLTKDICNKCGAKIEGISKFCKECGANLREFEGQKTKSFSCSNCGAESKKGDKFCEKCGSKLR